VFSYVHYSLVVLSVLGVLVPFFILYSLIRLMYDFIYTVLLICCQFKCFYCVLTAWLFCCLVYWIVGYLFISLMS
jgi:hypothetical protein